VRHDFKGRGELGRNELQKADKFWLRFSMIPIYNSENELSLGFHTRDVSDEKDKKKRKEQLIRDDCKKQ
jgi:hypothetical protein